MDTKVRHNGSSTTTVTLPERKQGRARNIYEVVAGALLSITGTGVFLAIITNEALYPAARHYRPSPTRSATSAERSLRTATWSSRTG